MSVCSTFGNPPCHDAIMLIFVHGSGSSGVAAWPEQAGMDATFLDLGSLPRTSAWADAIADAVVPVPPEEPVTVVAHSYGAVPLALAVPRIRIRLNRVVLVEPALYDIARTHPAVDRHVAQVELADAFAADGDLAGFWALIRPLLFGGDFDPDAWQRERPVAERLAAAPRPWGYGIRADTFAGLDATVVTGAWNAEYDAIAAVLERQGARHVVLPGHEHRPQDHPEFADVVVV